MAASAPFDAPVQPAYRVFALRMLMFLHSLDTGRVTRELEGSFGPVPVEQLLVHLLAKPEAEYRIEASALIACFTSSGRCMFGGGGVLLASSGYMACLLAWLLAWLLACLLVCLLACLLGCFAPPFGSDAISTPPPPCLPFSAVRACVLCVPRVRVQCQSGCLGSWEPSPASCVLCPQVACQT